MLKSFFYPQGKVHSFYPKYIAWSAASTFTVSLQTVLSTHSMLSVIGKSSSETLMSFNYIGKDLVGQVGGLFYMHKMGKRADKDPLSFFRYSMGIGQLSLFGENLTPFFSPFFLPVAGACNILNNISFAGFGAINAKCINMMALENNIGEMYAKLTVLNTLASSLGMISGLFLVSLFPDHYTRLAFLPFLSLFRWWTFNKSIVGLFDKKGELISVEAKVPNDKRLKISSESVLP